MIKDRYISQFIIIAVLCFILAPTRTLAQNGDDDIEVYLSFRYRGVVNSTIISYYKNDVFFLPVNELFSLFKIEKELNGLVISGRFSTSQIPYTIDLENQVITFDDKKYELENDDYLIKELDFYLTPSVYSEIFGLSYTINFNNLSLDLETDQKLPIVEQQLRNQRRRMIDTSQRDISYYELRADKNSDLLNGGFLDYSLSSITNSTQTVVNYNTSLGLQLLGGDLEGSIYGNYSNDLSTVKTDNLRWRYIVRENPGLSSITLGQTNLDGVLGSPYTGIRLTNEPVEPRRFYDEFVVQGSTFPQSEVELYLNNSLIDYEQANSAGNYRFLAPLYYGSSQLDLKIYGPTGQIIERTSRVQIPFTFLPVGEITYNVNAGFLDNPIIGSTEREIALQSNTAYGITNWLTAKGGIEYYGVTVNGGNPSFTSTVSTRIRTNYILTFEGVTNGYLRSSLSAIYPNSSSFSLDYTDFTTNSSIYNTAGSERQFTASFFYPFQILKQYFNIRTSSFTRFRENIPYTNFRLDANTRIQKLNLRLAYGNSIIDSYNPFLLNSQSNFEGSATYNISRNPNLPAFLRESFFRAQFRYLPHLKQGESAELLVSKNIFKRGRFQISYRRNFLREFNSLRFNFVINLDKVRSNTTITAIDNNYSATQNLRGSIGYDSNYHNFIFSSRDQVGRAATAIRMYVDNNGNGIYDEDEDDRIEEGNLRIDRIGSSSITKDNILYYSQMQPYYRYNMEMDKGSLKNPMLVPEIEKFSIITDPNTFKAIDIPFYMSGVFEGIVERLYSNDQTSGIGGVKIVLTQLNGDFRKELRTFSDGSFYDYEIPPGRYELKIDENQLRILNVEAKPAVINFEIKALPEGDFVEGLAFQLLPEGYREDQPGMDIDSLGIISGLQNSPEFIQLREELSANVAGSLRLLLQAQKAFYNRNFKAAINYINQSLDLFETAQGYALKGSLYYLMGDEPRAQATWDKAVRLDPDIYIPSMEILQEQVNPSSTETSSLE